MKMQILSYVSRKDSLYHVLTFIQQMLIAEGHTVMADSVLSSACTADLILIMGQPGLEMWQLITDKCGHIPVIYFSAATWEDEYIPVNGNIRHICFFDSVSRGYTDFPAQLTSVLHRPLLYLPIETDCQADVSEGIGFIGSDHDLYVLKQVVAVFNELSAYRFEIFSSEEEIPLIKSFCNDNIIIYPEHVFESRLPQLDIVVTNGIYAAIAIARKKKTIVAGRRGFGGIVSPHNLTAMINSSFSGRIGGNIRERIPFEMLIGELEYAYRMHEHDSGDRNEMALTVMSIYDKESLKQRIIDIISHVIQTEKGFSQLTASAGDLVPVFNSSLLVRDDVMPAHLLRAGSRKLVRELDENEYMVLRLLDGSRCVNDVAQLLDIDQQEMMAFLYSWWQEKIIYFRQTFLVHA